MERRLCNLNEFAPMVPLMGMLRESETPLVLSVVWGACFCRVERLP